MGIMGVIGEMSEVALVTATGEEITGSTDHPRLRNLIGQALKNTYTSLYLPL